MNKIYPYAGFWKRALAFIIDSFVLTIPTGIITGVLVGTVLVPQAIKLAHSASNGGEPSTEMVFGFIASYMASMALVWVLCVIIGWLYYAWMESGKKQATLGKLALGIKVTGAHGERISFARATGRFFAKMVSGMTLYFGFYMAGFTQKRQALHDIMATTCVVDKQCQEGAELPALPFSKGFCITSIVVALLPMVLYIMTILASLLLAVSEIEHRDLPAANASTTPAVETVK